jgi:ureidoglycolate hydrolase
MEKTLKYATATRENVAPYAELIDIEGAEALADVDAFAYWNDLSLGDFEGTATFGMVKTKAGGMAVPLLERHLRTSETLVPLDEDIVLVLAEPTSGSLPDLDNAAAFLVRRGQAVTLKRGTWHYIPLVPSGNAARTMVVFRRGTPSEDLEVKELQPELGTSLRVAG